MTRTGLIIVLVAAGCTRSDDTDAPPITDSPTASSPTFEELDDHVTAVEGSWVGQADPTPLGPMPFAMDFAWDGSELHGRADASGGFYLDFRFIPDGDGWVLREEGGLPGGLVQSRVLEPVAVDGDKVAWEDPFDPDYLYVETSLQGDRLVLDATVKQTRHAILDLARQ